ncbi:3-isopropylmalate dehydratase, partial [Methylobacterium frigidaeris]
MSAPATLALPGRVLHLAADPDLVRRQLAGEDLSLADAHPLRAEISTDEITPVPSLVHFDATLAGHAHIGFRAGDETPIAPGALKAGGFSVLVGGARYGKGSSREHAPLAERLSGIRLVIAESFERIYRQNADNLGLFTSTDMSLVARVQAGEAVTVDELVAGRDPLAAAILRAGGLLPYGRTQLAGARPAPLPDDGRPRTYFEKVVRRHALATPSCPSVGEAGQSGFVRADLRFIHDIYTGMARHLLGETFGGDLALHDPASILAFEDHYSYTHLSHAHRHLMPHVAAASRAHRAFVAEHGLTHHGYLADGPGSEGISHALMAERYA